MTNCSHDPDHIENDEVTADEHDRECLGHVHQDFTGAISGFDFPENSRVSQNDKYPDHRNLGIGHGNEHPNFDPSILATSMEFGAGMIRKPRVRQADYLAANGREDEAYERDE